MNESWVKLYRKTLQNGILKDHKAWAVFSWLLLMVDKDTGKRTFGRFQLSDELGIKPNTLYSIIKRLQEKYKVLQVINKKTYTEVLVVNWAKYQHQQSEQSNDIQMPIKRESNDINTKQELRIENKEYKYIEYLKNFPIEDFKDLDATEKQLRNEAENALNWLLSEGKKKKDYRAFLRKWFTGTYGKFKKRVSAEPIEKYEIDPNGLARLKEFKKSFEMKGMN